MEDYKRDQVLFKEVPIAKCQSDERICGSIRFKMFVDIFERFETVLMLDINLKAINLLGGAYSLNAEK